MRTAQQQAFIRRIDTLDFRNGDWDELVRAVEAAFTEERTDMVFTGPEDIGQRARVIVIRRQVASLTREDVI